ncbi:MAG: hypothetical protein IIA49_07865 [Bacteroidetes bacterium]|nr:hypothetical protein [Bacteroidota bacterium]
MNLGLSPKKVIRVLIIIVCAIAIISLLGQFYKFLLFDGKERYLVNFFSLDKEFNIPTWYQAISELMCSLLLAIIFMAAKVENDRFKYHWLGLSLIFLLIATDEMLVLHEQIISPLRKLLGTGGFLSNAWIIPAIILGIVFIIAYYKFLRSLPSTTRKRFIVAGLIFGSGAVGMEAIGGWISTLIGNNNLTYSLMTNVEEILEMSGILLFIYSLLLYFQIQYPAVTFSVGEKG